MTSGARRSHRIRCAAIILALVSAAIVVVADTGVRTDDTAILARDFHEFHGGIDARLGVLLTPVGGLGHDVDLGDWRTGPAWSTIKVPLVMAALRDERRPALITPQMTAAITQSDNAAADAIWADLGEPLQAAHKVQDVLADAGDFTSVQWQKFRPQFSAYGQTNWSLAAQAHYLALAGCDKRYAPVLHLMGQIDVGQRWGLGKIAGARFKGGWGPSPSGKYLERQMGLIVTPRGITSIAVAAEPNSGLFADGLAALDRLAEWLSEHSALLPGDRCR